MGQQAPLQGVETILETFCIYVPELKYTAYNIQPIRKEDETRIRASEIPSASWQAPVGRLHVVGRGRRAVLQEDCRQARCSQALREMWITVLRRLPWACSNSLIVPIRCVKEGFNMRSLFCVSSLLDLNFSISSLGLNHFTATGHYYKYLLGLCHQLYLFCYFLFFWVCECVCMFPCVGEHVLWICVHVYACTWWIPNVDNNSGCPQLLSVGGYLYTV